MTNKKIDFEMMDDLFGSIFNAFSDDDTDEISEEGAALWTLALSVGGWTAAQFWEAYDLHYNVACPDCGKKRHEDIETASTENVEEKKPAFDKNQN